MICGGANGASACVGDSGGPLVCEEAGRWVLRGASSWVSGGRCPTYRFSVYARVSSFVNWVKEITGRLM